jgi:hypothetical protein
MSHRPLKLKYTNIVLVTFRAQELFVVQCDLPKVGEPVAEAERLVC